MVFLLSIISAVCLFLFYLIPRLHVKHFESLGCEKCRINKKLLINLFSHSLLACSLLSKGLHPAKIIRPSRERHVLVLLKYKQCIPKKKEKEIRKSEDKCVIQVYNIWHLKYQHQVKKHHLRERKQSIKSGFREFCSQKIGLDVFYQTLY